MGIREIIFRAKSKFDKDNKWVYGDLIQGENSYISTKEEFYSAVVGLGGHLSTCVELVDKETVGQFTGLCDKNGTKIFEGDIVEICCKRISGGRQLSKHDIPTKCRVVVKFVSGHYFRTVGYIFDYNNKFNDKVCQPIGNEQYERDLLKRNIADFVFDENNKKEDHPNWRWKNYIKVIGNIYENSELLEE